METEHTEYSEDPVRLLVHNVSHADLCMTIQPSSVMYINQDRELMARPRASRYKHVCDEITNAIEKGAKYKGCTYKDKCNNPRSVGFLFDPPCRIGSWSDFRLRDPNNTKTTSESLSCCVARVFFPLISVLIPQWMALAPSIEHSSPPIVPRYHLGALPNDLSENNDTTAHIKVNYTANLNTISYSDDSSDNNECKHDTNTALTAINAMQSMIKKVSEVSIGSTSTYKDFEPTTQTKHKLFIISGAGHPLKKKSVYYQEDSTQKLAHLLCRFIVDFYPQIAVQQFYSDDIFQYVENIKFVHSQLRPAIDKERQTLATMHGKHWKKYFNLAVTLCDGTPARLSA
eukprot:250082_1